MSLTMSLRSPVDVTKTKNRRKKIDGSRMQPVYARRLQARLAGIPAVAADANAMGEDGVGKQNAEKW